MLWEEASWCRSTARLTPGALVSFLLYAITVAAAVGSLASLFGSYQEALGAATRVFELLDVCTDRRRARRIRAARARPVRGDVRLEAVSFGYSTDMPAILDDVSLHIAPGRGRGARSDRPAPAKTTIASLIPRFWDVTSGRIELDGVDIRDLSFADLRGSIGIVPQDPALFSGTIRDNIAYARPDEVRRPSADGGRDRRGSACGARAGVHRAAAGGTGHPGRRAWGEAVGRSTSTGGDRPRIPEKPGRRGARRGDVESRYGERATDRGGDGGSAARPVDADHRPSLEHRAAREDRVVVLERGKIVEAGDARGVVGAGGLFGAGLAGKELVA